MLLRELAAATERQVVDDVAVDDVALVVGGNRAIVGARAAEDHLAVHLSADRRQNVLVAAGAGGVVDRLGVGVVGGERQAAARRGA